MEKNKKEQIILAIIIILTAVISFFVGYISGKIMTNPYLSPLS